MSSSFPLRTRLLSKKYQYLPSIWIWIIQKHQLRHLSILNVNWLEEILVCSLLFPLWFWCRECLGFNERLFKLSYTELLKWILKPPSHSEVFILVRLLIFVKLILYYYLNSCLIWFILLWMFYFLSFFPFFSFFFFHLLVKNEHYLPTGSKHLFFPRFLQLTVNITLATIMV